MKKHTVFIKSLLLSLFLSVSALSVTGCGPSLDTTSIEPLEQRVLYLACNLFADPNRKNALYSVNYHLRGNILRWGTAMKITGIEGDHVILEDVQSGTTYTYSFHERTLQVTTPGKHLERILVEDRDALQKEVDAMPYIDRDGITKAKVLVGMSKRAVLIAIGYPPEFTTPDPMTADHWTYWYDRFKQFVVAFDSDDKVVAITGYYPDRESM